MAKYPPFHQKDADVFLTLYKELLDYEFEKMKHALKELPTDAIERVFSSTDIHKKKEELFISFGFSHIEKVARELESSYKLHLDSRLVEALAQFGAKINPNKIGVRN